MTKLRSDKTRCWYCRAKPASLESISGERKRDRKAREKEEEEEKGEENSQDSWYKALDLPPKKKPLKHGQHATKRCPLGCGYSGRSDCVKRHSDSMVCRRPSKK
jgi:hypothetical protein